MESTYAGIDRELVLDGNAVAGLLQEIFSVEMTASPTECAHCGRKGELATLRAYTRSSGVVLRCSSCGEVVLRIVQTPRAIHLDARGAKCLSLERQLP